MQDSLIIMYILQHAHCIDGDEDDIKFIGVYSSFDNAQSALERTKSLPGFSDAPDGFSIDKYVVDEDNWKEGYATA